MKKINISNIILVLFFYFGIQYNNEIYAANNIIYIGNILNESPKVFLKAIGVGESTNKLKSIDLATKDAFKHTPKTFMKDMGLYVSKKKVVTAFDKKHHVWKSKVYITWDQRNKINK